ncbi:MAG: methyltransferase domain-containing protein [SAR324 cluster bacterium]|nr:methyltransferase domain-containing protein [SAR324 cluster bacterium]
MASSDPWGKTDQMEDAVLDGMVTRLEARGKFGPFMKMLDEYLGAMEIDGKQDVLDLGCGTGIVARTIAARGGFSGKVLGIDLSPYLVEAAARLAGEEGLSQRVAFEPGDTRSLELRDGRFDAVVAHTLLSHLGDPFSVLQDIARVVKSGGVVGIFDGDYGSRSYAQEDLEKMKRDNEIVTSAVVASPYVMRLMPRYLRRAGLELTACFPYVLAEIGQADYWGSAIESNRSLLPAAGAMTKEQADIWADELLGSSQDGVFFGACNFYAYVATKP